MATGVPFRAVRECDAAWLTNSQNSATILTLSVDDGVTHAFLLTPEMVNRLKSVLDNPGLPDAEDEEE